MGGCASRRAQEEACRPASEQSSAHVRNAYRVERSCDQTSPSLAFPASDARTCGRSGILAPCEDEGRDTMGAAQDAPMANQKNGDTWSAQVHPVAPSRVLLPPLLFSSRPKSAHSIVSFQHIALFLFRRIQ